MTWSDIHDSGRLGLIRSRVEFKGRVGGNNLRRYMGSLRANGQNFNWNGYAEPSIIVEGQGNYGKVEL
jgi:hypothetical protein